MSRRTAGVSHTPQKKVSTRSRPVKTKIVYETPEKKEVDDFPESIPESSAKDNSRRASRASKKTIPKKLAWDESKSESLLSLPKERKPIKSSVIEAKEYIEGCYETVDSNIVSIQSRSNSKQYIFYHLSPRFWPVLPMGHKWFVDNFPPTSMPVVKKHSDFFKLKSKQEFKITIFGPNEEPLPNRRANYTVSFNNRNVQCYANAIPTGEVGVRKNEYPISVEDYKIGIKSSHDRGHCVDYIFDIQKDPLPSSSHPSNFKPELRFWNQTLRRTWVGRIISADGAYMERTYYHHMSLYHLASKPILTNNGTPVPAGVYFAEINSDRRSIIRTADVSWKYNFDKIYSKEKSRALLILILYYRYFL